jgi:hypothetical protein
VAFCECNAHSDAQKDCAVIECPSILYCDVLYSQSLVGVNSMLNVAFNCCARYIYGTPRGGSLSTFFRHILGVPINIYFDLRKATMIYKFLSTRVPDYLSDQFQLGMSNQDLEKLKKNP